VSDLGAHKRHAMPTFKSLATRAICTHSFYFFLCVCVGGGGVIHRIMNWILAK
jgi:hypothetical protein